MGRKKQKSALTAMITNRKRRKWLLDNIALIEERRKLKIDGRRIKRLDEIGRQ